MLNVECGMLNCAPMAHVELFNVECGMWSVECGVWNVELCAYGACGIIQ